MKEVGPVGGPGFRSFWRTLRCAPEGCGGVSQREVGGQQGGKAGGGSRRKKPEVGKLALVVLQRSVDTGSVQRKSVGLGAGWATG